jgi:hypothetical protein
MQTAKNSRPPSADPQPDRRPSSVSTPAEPAGGTISSNTQDARSKGGTAAAADGSPEDAAVGDDTSGKDPSAAVCWPGFNAAQKVKTAAAGGAGNGNADSGAVKGSAWGAADAVGTAEAPEQPADQLKDAASAAAAAASEAVVDAADRACAGAVIAAEHMLKSAEPPVDAAAHQAAKVS